ncbi:MAG: DUF2442 domain-containing protein [Methylococcales bacterium]|jgi:hypothetical protein|nr:DUF2442 domain-containing protein [Methylococcales bacterium]
MKLKSFTQQDGYRFTLIFENGEIKDADLKNLIGSHVELEALKTARIDSEWGCFEFKNGCVDVEPKTLYRYATS